jgi:hypothetical protein
MNHLHYTDNLDLFRNADYFGRKAYEQAAPHRRGPILGLRAPVL